MGPFFYTSALTPALPLRADVNIYSPGASLLNMHVEGDPVTDTLEPPVLSPGAGTYSSVQSVTMTSVTGATIRYTTDGTDPTESSTAYTGAVTIGQTTTLKAKTWKTGYFASAVAAATYVMKVPVPTLVPGAGTYTTPQSVVISESLAGADIHYTTNGVDPTQADAAIASGGSIAISAPLELKVRAWKSGWTASDVVSAIYSFKVATPTLTPATGSYTGSVPVTVSTSSPEATLHYTLDGGVPAEADPVVASGSAVSVERSGTLKVRGWRTGWTPSDAARGHLLDRPGYGGDARAFPSAGHVHRSAGRYRQFDHEWRSPPVHNRRKRAWVPVSDLCRADCRFLDHGSQGTGLRTRHDPQHIRGRTLRDRPRNRRHGRG